ncbi:MAG: hypothetical protein M1422_06635 [Candidatus Thermoplasmatota archaeon]|nr:hypothetical protein [Candidatus Sysuiplasma jiujiangense]MCL4317927.1 hypothetical protein [Candidatus Thermoplasmatota archaeon]
METGHAAVAIFPDTADDFTSAAGSAYCADPGENVSYGFHIINASPDPARLHRTWPYGRTWTAQGRQPHTAELLM